MNDPVSILLVDDEPVLRRATALLLSNRGGSVAAAATADEAVALAAARLYDVAIFDVSAGPSASEVIGRMRAGGRVPRRVIVCDGKEAAGDAPEVDLVLQKPYAFERLLAAVFGARRESVVARTHARPRMRVRDDRSLKSRAPRRAPRAAPARG